MGDTFGMLGQAPSNGQILPNGVDLGVRRRESGAFYTLVPIRPRRRGERRSLRTFPGVSLRPHLAFNPRPRRLSTPTDAFQLHPDIRFVWNDPHQCARRRTAATRRFELVRGATIQSPRTAVRGRGAGRYAPSARVVWIDEDEGRGRADRGGRGSANDSPGGAGAEDATAFDAVRETTGVGVARARRGVKDLVRKTDRERTPNHIELVESHLGTMPDPEKHPRAAWRVTSRV